MWTISTHFSEVLKAILSLHGEFIKLPDPSVEPPNDYKWKWFPNALGALDGCHVNICVNMADQGRYRDSKILAQSGFGWDWEKNVLQINSDEVWDRYVEVRDMPLSFYIILTYQSNQLVVCRLMKKQLSIGTK
jgi:hypothetical protein